jgi:hypothetical protein
MPISFPRAPVLGRDSGQGLLRQHCTPPRDSIIDRNQSGSYLHQRHVEGVVRLAVTYLYTSLAFHSQTDNQSEVTNKIIPMYLRCLVGDHQRSWLP